MLLLIALSAQAKSAPDLTGFDLRLDPGDVAPVPVPPLVPGGPIAAKVQDQSVPEIVSEIDQVNRPETPNRRVSGTGPLGNFKAADDGVLKDFLENRTIPLFRVRVESPF